MQSIVDRYINRPTTPPNLCAASADLQQFEDQHPPVTTLPSSSTAAASAPGVATQLDRFGAGPPRVPHHRYHRLFVDKTERRHLAPAKGRSAKQRQVYIFTTFVP